MKAAESLQKLEYEDIRILTAVEIGMKKHEYVPIEHVKFYSRMKQEETEYRLDRIHKLDLLIRAKGARIGYCLNMEAYDILALHTFFEKGILTSIGASIGRGKESDVYRCLNAQGEQVALKIFRLGQTSFRNIRILRSYLEERGHMNWLYASRLCAMQEFKGLQKIAGLNLQTPRPIAQNRHAIVMSIIQGDEIANFNALNDPKSIFDQIINQYKQIYSIAHVIHGDLGEYNILIDPDDDILIIDWAQWVDWNHPNAHELMTRDITNVCDFFRKKYGIGSEATSIINELLSTNPSTQHQGDKIE
jgi:RIO kinase 2